MVRTANPLEAEIALNKSPTFSLSFLNVAEFAAETVPVLEISVASEVWPSAVLAKTQSPPIQSPQSNNQWFPIPNVATVDLASTEYFSDAIDVVKPDPPYVYVVTVDVDSIVQFLMWYPNEALKELPKKYLTFKP